MRHMLTALACACLSLTAGADDLDALKTRGTLRVLRVPSAGVNEFFQDDTHLPGFDRELLEGFAQLHGLSVRVVPVSSWDELAPALLARRGDVIAGRYTATATRRKQIAFTRETFPTRVVVVTRRPGAVVSTLAELLRERIGTVRGSSMVEALLAAGVPAERIDDSLKPGQQVAALVAGQVSAVVMGVENAIAEQRRDPALQLGLFLGPPGSLAWGVHPDDAALLAALNVYIDNVNKSPTWGRLVAKYFGSAALEVLKKARSE